MYRFLVATTLLLCLSIGVAAQTIEIGTLDADNVELVFSNARFVEYQGQPALSVDVRATATTTLRNRVIPFANIHLLMYDRNPDQLRTIEVYASLLNSSTLGRVVELSQDGADYNPSADTTPQQVRGVQVPARGVHSGVLLFLLPDNGILIHGIGVGDTTAPVIETPNQYIDLPTLEREAIWQTLSEVMVPTQPHMHLLRTYLEMQRFLELNDSLRLAW